MSRAERRIKRIMDKFKWEYLDMIQRHSENNSRNSFAAVVGVEESALYVWARFIPAFRVVFMALKKEKGSMYASK